MIQNPTPALILASASTTRANLLRGAGLAFSVQPAAVDEAALKAALRGAGASTTEAALALADAKATPVARRCPEALVIGADQVLDCAGIWFDKPIDADGARAQLRDLRGRAHDLATAVVCRRGPTALWQHVSVPRLCMRPFSDAFLDAYVNAESAALLTSVGAYRMEGLGQHLFAEVTGEHAAILGLPMLALLGFLRGFGVVRS